MIKRFAGINIAVKDLDAAMKKYSDFLGVKPIPYRTEDFAYPGLKGASFHLGDVKIFLIASEQPETPVAKFIEAKGEGVSQISLEVTDIEKDVKDLTEKGVKFVSDKPLTFSDGKVNFTHPKSMHGVEWEFMQVVPGATPASR